MLKYVTDMNQEEQKYLSYTESIMFAAELLARACKESMRKLYKQMGFKIGHEEYIILEIICQHPGIIQFDIAKKLFMQRSYVCKMLIKLEETGYVRREAAIKGKRKAVTKFYLTEMGEAAYAEIREFIMGLISKSPKECMKKRIEMTEYMLNLTEKLRVDYNLKL